MTEPCDACGNGGECEDARTWYEMYREAEADARREMERANDNEARVESYANQRDGFMRDNAVLRVDVERERALREKAERENAALRADVERLRGAMTRATRLVHVTPDGKYTPNIVARYAGTALALIEAALAASVADAQEQNAENLQEQGGEKEGT